jgi:3-deoxy-D-manno-octulosonate cytidylyltransferase
MNVISVIPARYASSRFPGKLMEILDGKTIILRTYEQVLATDLFDEVIVATDSKLIYDEIISNGGNVVMSKKEHQCGSDRIAEAVENINVDVVVNVQGDEPFIDAESLKDLISVFHQDLDGRIDLASLMTPIKDPESILDPSNVKVIVDRDDFAMYFSRSPIPYKRDLEYSFNYFKHIGVYAFRKKALIDFSKQEFTPLETAEKIECIRYLEYGKRIKMVETKVFNFGIDTPTDLKKAKAFLEKQHL